MADTLNLLPCPFCGSGKVRMMTREDMLDAVMCDDCTAEGPAFNTPDMSSVGWNRRAPAAAVPDGALPKGWEDRIGAPYKRKDINDIPLTAQIHHMQAEIAEWRARAAVEAHRAQQGEPVAMRLEAAALMAKTLRVLSRKSGLRINAELISSIEGILKAWDAASAHDMQWRECSDCEGSAKISANEWCERCDRSGILPGLATKASAPADAWTAEQIADACVRAGLGILECNSLIVTLKGAAPVPDTGTPTAGAVETYTCIGKGGTYELLGIAKGAGTVKLAGNMTVYRDTEGGQLYYRAAHDFNSRMERIAAAPQPSEAKAGETAEQIAARWPQCSGLKPPCKFDCPCWVEAGAATAHPGEQKEGRK